jgi:uncharacterized repeat protein (TIGR02543 family)
MKSLIYLVVSATMFGVVLTSCNKEDDNPKEFTVTFETSNGGSTVVPQNVKKGGKVIKPEEAPTRSGYVFVEWFKEAVWTNEWEFDTDIVTTNVTLYAKWIADENDIEINDIISGNLVEIKATVENARNDIVTVKARIYSLIGFPDDGWHWAEYILASVKYENDSFAMSFPATVPDEYLWTNVTEGIPISDTKAKWGRVTIDAYNSDGKMLGSFYLVGKECAIEYMYSDRSFTEKGTTYYGYEFDCSYEKGWNITYLSYWKRATQKPINESFKWKFSERAY